MTIPRSLFCLGLAFLCPSWANAEAQNLAGSPTSAEQQVLSLNFTNNGQHLTASVGQQIEITLGTVGPPQYGEPQVSSTAIRLESTALVGSLNPGGPTFIYIFEAAAEGEAQVQIPLIGSDDPDLTKQLTFAVTIRVGTADTNSRALRASMTPDQAHLLSLNFKNNGQHLTAVVGQQIEITLGTVGPRQYGSPQVSTTAIRLESTALDWPPIPAGPRFTYIFEAAAEGEAQVQVPIISPDDRDSTKQLTFAVTIRVETADTNSRAPRASMTPDQANTELWKNAATNMHNDVRQSFVPSLPRLTGVEVELMVINPGATSDDVTMTLMNAEGVALAVVSKAVPVDDCRHVLFLLPKGGLPVSPGQAYSIGLSSDGVVFGWKYVVGGYAKGAASWNGKPLLRDIRSTFLFRTFGAS